VDARCDLVFGEKNFHCCSGGKDGRAGGHKGQRNANRGRRERSPIL
jgi:hypothetical protein